MTHHACPYCGGLWSESMDRYWHTGHPADCRAKQMRAMKAARARSEAAEERAQQDREERALRGPEWPVETHRGQHPEPCTTCEDVRRMAIGLRPKDEERFENVEAGWLLDG